MRAPRLILFTDLDGTLLDPRDFSWAAAEEALAELARQHVPLVLCTSKTRAEVEPLRRKLSNAHPFITENGGGVFIPDSYFPQRISGSVKLRRYHCLALGRSYSELTEALKSLAEETGVEVVGFHQLTPREVAENTGLPPRLAELARRREFDEPFFFVGVGEREEQRLAAAARARGLSVVRGGRFWHLMGGCDKGRAVRLLMSYYRGAFPHQRLRSSALGDSENDLTMLEAVDRAVLLPGPAGAFDPVVLQRLPRVIRAAVPGPRGWNFAVLQLLQSDH